MTKLRVGSKEYQLPRSKPLRIAVGVLLVILGFLGFLPVIGFWMIPLGIAVLSIDIPPIRRARRRFATWWGRRRQRKMAMQSGVNPTKGENSSDIS